MYNNPYLSNSQQNIDRINSQINELEKIRNQLQNPVQPPAINQTFQLASNNNYQMKFADNVDELKKEIVTADTPYFSKDLSIVWIKNNKNEIKTYEMKEIVPLDSKDIKIQYLEAQIEELKKGIISNESNANIDEPIANTDTSKKSTSVSNVSKSKTKSK